MDMEVEGELTVSSRIINIIKEIQNLHDGTGANLTMIYKGLNGIKEDIVNSIEEVKVTITLDVIREELNKLVINGLLLRFISSDTSQQLYEIAESYSNRILDLSQCGDDYQHFIHVMSKCLIQVKKELSSKYESDEKMPDFHEMTEYIRHSFNIKVDEEYEKTRGDNKWSFLENLVRDTLQRLQLDDIKEKEKLALIRSEKLMTESKELEGIEEIVEDIQMDCDSIDIKKSSKENENTIDVNVNIRSKSKRLSAMKKDPPTVLPQTPKKDCQIAIKNFKLLMSPKKKAKRAIYKIKNNIITYKGFKFQNPTVSLTRLPLKTISDHDHLSDNLNDNSFFASTSSPELESPIKAKNYKKQESILKFFAIESPTIKDKNKDPLKEKDLGVSTDFSEDMNKSKEKSKVENKEDVQVDIVEKMDHQNQNVEVEEKCYSKKKKLKILPKTFETNAKNKGSKCLNEFSRKIVKKRFTKPLLISKESTLSAATIKNFRGRGPASRFNNKKKINASKSGTSTSIDQTENRAEISPEPELQEKEKTELELELEINQRDNTILNDNYTDKNQSLNPSSTCSAKEELFNLGELLLEDTNSFDYQIIVNYQVFKVHKNVLSCQSEYFSKLFKTKNHQPSLLISDIDPKSFNSILNFLYKGQFKPDDSLSLKSILEYLGFGIKYGIKRLETFCKMEILKVEK